MAQAYVPIQTVTVGSGGSATIDFVNIPQTYTDLVVVSSVRGTVSGANSQRMYFNGNNTNTNKYLLGDGSSASSLGNSTDGYTGTIFGTAATANTFNSTTVYIPNYTSSNYKSASVDSVAENNATNGYDIISAILWSNTAAITQITLKPDGSGNTFAQYSTATLYGIGGARASGGTITADSRYTYHTFTSSGTFTALEKIKGAEILIVGGGAGGGNDTGGGGGAGGVVYGTPQVIASGSIYTASIGGGGAAATSGTDSSFTKFTVAATGGGRGGNANNDGTAGGCGGGSSYHNRTGASSTQTLTGTNLIGYGNAGGNGGTGGGYGMGGGGGAGAAGGNGSTTLAGNGGIGLAKPDWAAATGTGGSGYYAGGGGGGAYATGGGTAGSGGLGGGAAGSASNGVAGSNATTNTGGGGGGAGGGGNGAGGAGASGIVIVRYPN